MSGTLRQASMTADEFLALPEDGIERDLIQGEMREYEMTRRCREHARIEANISFLLKLWAKEDRSRGTVYAGEVGCLLKRDPDTAVGIDIALFADSSSTVDETSTILVGPPILAVEILSPNDTQKRINEKIDLYLEAGVGIVWIVNPHFRTVEIHTKGQEPRLFNIHEELPEHPCMPGLRLPVAKIFEK